MCYVFIILPLFVAGWRLAKIKYEVPLRILIRILLCIRQNLWLWAKGRSCFVHFVAAVPSLWGMWFSFPFLFCPLARSQSRICHSAHCNQLLLTWKAGTFSQVSQGWLLKSPICSCSLLVHYQLLCQITQQIQTLLGNGSPVVRMPTF